MRGISQLFELILVLMIAIGLISMGHVFLSGMLNKILQGTEGSLNKQTESRLAEITITNITVGAPSHAFVKNTGKVNVTNFNVFVENMLANFNPS